MKTILIVYIIVINLTGFLIMGIDKSRAKRNRWRVQEKTLFLIAFLFGSIGILTGMYVFHHKTRHLSFRLGIPAILVLQIALACFLCALHSRYAGSPSQTVRRELDLIRNLDDDTIQSYVSYGSLLNSRLSSGETGSDSAEAVTLFFKNFKYHILDEQIDGAQAVVNVSITNIDMHQLAQDLCTRLLQESVSLYPQNEASTTGDYYRLLRDTLAGNTYSTVTTTACFHLQKGDSGWEILSDEKLEDELVSGFISSVNDPYILPAVKVLSLHLDALKALTPEQWAEYLSIDDVFATCNTDYSGLIDEEYIRQLATDFDYEILRCTENGDTAEAAVRITSIDMSNVLTAYRKHLVAYAATTRSLRDSEVEFSNTTARLLLQSLQENDRSASTDINIIFHNNGSVWEITFDNEFTNALMGNMSGAIDKFNLVSPEDNSWIVAPAG